MLMKEKKNIISDERRTNDLSDMHDVLDSFARKMLGKKAFAEADVICHWKDIAGEETARFSRPLKIDFKKDQRTDGTLWIEISGGAFALEIQSKSTILIRMPMYTSCSVYAVRSLSTVFQMNTRIFCVNVKDAAKGLLFIIWQNIHAPVSWMRIWN